MQTEQERMRRLTEVARRRFGRNPVFVVKAPGRVNLIGEHTDYNGLPVMPMAIDKSVLIAVFPRTDPLVTLENTGNFRGRSYRLQEVIAPFGSGDWGNYSKAAAQGLRRSCPGHIERGADLLVDGNIPTGAGLSSSSALVVANALSLLATNGHEVPPLDLAGLLAEAERYVGTLSGGMDQAVSLMAQAGNALRIDFEPLRCRPVPLPLGYSFVVCHSLVVAEKSGATRRDYNLRVIECRLACQMLDRALGNAPDSPPSTLGDLCKKFPERRPSSFIDELAALVTERPITLDQAAELLGAPSQKIRQACAVAPGIGDEFSLLRRARHVLTEAERVDEAEAAASAGDAPRLGTLMNRSHESCRDDYQVSCPELEVLVGVARESGSLGTRLTGAGFGGCTVSLVPDTEVDRFLHQVDERFYVPRLRDSQQARDWRFVMRPESGAEVLRV